jgi:biotin carboxyl carrier protein
MTMPTYETYVDGKPRKIELTKKTEKAFTAKTEDKTLNVELNTNKLDTTKPLEIKMDGKTYKIQIPPKIERDKPISVKVEETTFKVELKTPTKTQTFTTFEPVKLTVKKMTANKQNTEGTVTAPMTGKIVSVKVKKGDGVKTGQVLCIIEAMKMENEIYSPKTGTVQQVNVSDGSSVNDGEILFVIG